VPEADVAGAADLSLWPRLCGGPRLHLISPPTRHLLELERIKRELRTLAAKAVVGTAPPTARGAEIREDKAAKRKAALTKAGGKYQEQVNRPWRTFRWGQRPRRKTTSSPGIRPG
jgi:hypothetical protein